MELLLQSEYGCFLWYYTITMVFFFSYYIVLLCINYYRNWSILKHSDIFMDIKLFWEFKVNGNLLIFKPYLYWTSDLKTHQKTIIFIIKWNILWYFYNMLYSGLRYYYGYNFSFCLQGKSLFFLSIYLFITKLQNS